MKFADVKVDDKVVLENRGGLMGTTYMFGNVVAVTKTRFRVHFVGYDMEYEFTKDGDRYPRDRQAFRSTWSTLSYQTPDIVAKSELAEKWRKTKGAIENLTDILRDRERAHLLVNSKFVNECSDLAEKLTKLLSDGLDEKDKDR